MEENSKQQFITIPEIGKKIKSYHYGSADRKILLVHGWSGRGTQLVKIADALLSEGFSTLSFDAPAHGKSPGKTTLMTEFIGTIHELDRQFGPFEAVIGHSLGGMALLNAAGIGLNTKSIITIGSGDKINDILLDFVSKLKMKPALTTNLKRFFEEKYNIEMESFSGWIAAQKVHSPVLLIHDTDDDEVPAACSKNIFTYLSKGKLLLTSGLGHRKILGDPEVIANSIQFIKQHL